MYKLFIEKYKYVVRDESVNDDSDNLFNKKMLGF